MAINEEYKKAYINFLRQKIDAKKPITVVFDASNGPAGIIVKDLWQGTPVQVIVINDQIDPDFSAHGPNPLSPGATDQAAQKIKEHTADLGVLFDADADRAIFLDNTGEIVPACFIATLLFKESKMPCVADELVYQSLEMLKSLPEEEVLPSRIGSFFIKECMRTEFAVCGAESSGHYYFKDFFNADSGIFAAIVVINALSKMDTPISDWKKSFGDHEVVAHEVRFEGKDPKTIYKDIEEKYASKVSKIEKRDGVTLVFPEFWINVRSSNTEPVMRLSAGGVGSEMNEKIKEIEKLIA